MRGDFGEGWDEYEWRLRSSERKGPRFPEKPWQGESLAGKHIYVQAEQGFGDTLQFARYIPPLAARARKVTVRVHQQLVTLLRESLPGITVLGDRGDPEPYPCDAVLLSLPRLLEDAARNDPRACAVSARARGCGGALAPAARQNGRPQGRVGMGGQSRARQRSSPLGRSVAVGPGPRNARRVVREPSGRSARPPTSKN